MRRILILLLPLAAAALVAAGCGSSNKSSSSSSSSSGGSSSSASTSTPSSSGSSGGGTTIKMQNIAFAPKDTTVKVGQKVQWENEDTVAHNVTATSGATFKSSNFGKGGSFSFTPTKAGTIKYVCTIHPGMDATLTVTQ
jgi:plastocyanin